MPIVVDSKDFARCRNYLSEIPKKVPSILSRSINYSIRRTKTFIMSEKGPVRSAYNVSRASLAKKGVIKTKFAEPSLSPYGALITEGKRLPLYAFLGKKIAGQRTGWGQHVAVEVLKGQRKTLSHAFIATTPPPSNHTGIWERTGQFAIAKSGRYKGKMREKIRELFTINVAQMVGGARASEQVQAFAREQYRKEVVRLSNVALKTFTEKQNKKPSK
jgi:hypothetical protein